MAGTRHMLVKRINPEGDRTLFYGERENYCIIAKPDEVVDVGDFIEYKPGGIYFGWFVKRFEQTPGTALALVLRKDPEDLSAEERASLETLYSEEVQYLRIDSADYKEHDEICQRLKPATVILPLDRPIPSLAMEHGHRHIALTPDGPLELLPLVPQFKPFVP